MAALKDFTEFNLEEANVRLWVLKGPTGPSGDPPKFSGRWVETTDDVDAVLKGTVERVRQSINEVIEYDLLAQNNESSALVIATDETYADRLVERVSAETNERRAKTVAQLHNSSFYDVKLVQGQSVIHAIRKTDKSWQAKRAIGLSTLLFQEEVLSLEQRPTFDVDKSIDFVIVNREILILNKAHFESILRYKATFIEDFAALQAEPAFLDAFVDVGPLVAFVGDNKINLRRLSAIRKKGHYRDPAFMTRLRELHQQYDLHINFDAGGRIVVTPENCREVITALLDHRLASAFSRTVYDVPSTTPVRAGAGAAP